MPDTRLRELWLRPEHWTALYAFYRCPEDPRLVVPKPNRDGVPKWWLGTTWNIAHRGAWLAMALAVGAFLLPVALAYGLGVREAWVLASVAVATFALEWLVAWRMAADG